MSLSTIELGLNLGGWVPSPAPAHLMRALRNVEVTQKDAAPCGFQLTFLAEIVSMGESFDVVSDPLLVPFTRVTVRVAVDGVPTTLIDGFITHHQYMPGNGPDDSLFVVTGEDLSVKMDLVEMSMEFPALPDADIVLAVLAPWLALGIEPQVIPWPPPIVPVDQVPQQRQTDRAFLQQLAQKNGNVFYVAPTPVAGVNVAYWGPPPRLGAPSAVIDVAVGAGSTADSFSAEANALAPETYWGLAMLTDVEPYEPLPVLTVTGERLPPLALQPMLDPLASRHKIWCGDQYDPATSNVLAQAMTDASTDEAVRVTCAVTPARLGTVVSAPGVVGVRGTGLAYDGLYYLQAATHRIGLGENATWDYTQELTMTREGTGSTVPAVLA